MLCILIYDSEKLIWLPFLPRHTASSDALQEYGSLCEKFLFFLSYWVEQEKKKCYGTESIVRNHSVSCVFPLFLPKVKVLVAQLCTTLSDPVDGSPPGSSVHGSLRQEYQSG